MRIYKLVLSLTEDLLRIYKFFEGSVSYLDYSKDKNIVLQGG